MAYENILFHQKHLVVVDGYFYLLDYTQRLLSQKTSAGATSFQYPVDIPSSFTAYTVGDILCLQYDGYNFWTLQKLTDLTGFVIRCWNITNFICTLVRQFPLLHTTGIIKYDIKTIAIEHYTTFLSQNIVDGSYIISIDEHVEFAVLPGTTIGLGFNKFNERELVTVSGVVNQDIYLNSPVSRNYFVGDPVTIVASIFVFNDYNTYISDTYGSLIVLNPYTGTQISKFSNVEYKGVSASKFYRLQGVLQAYPDVFTLAFTKETNLKLRDLRDLYRYKADVRASDLFTDVDFALPNDTRWDIALGNPIIYNNSLYFSAEGGGHDRVSSSYLLLDTFETQISGSLFGVTTYTGIDLKYYKHYMNFDFKSDNTSVAIGLMKSSDYYNIVSDTGLILYYKFDNNLLDSSGNNFVTNVTVAPTYVEGINTTVSGAANFITTTAINVTNTSLLEIGKNGTDFSVVFWLKLLSAFDTVNHIIIQKGTSTSFRTPCVWALANANSLFFGVSTTVNSTQGVTVTNTPINTWINVAYINKDNTLYVYYNKVLKGSLILSGTVVSNTSNFYVGATSMYTGKAFAIDELKLYNRALSFYEVKDIFEKDTNYFTSLNNKDILGVTVNGSLDQYVVMASGIDNLSYKFKAIKSTNSLTLSYITLTSGIQNSDWLNFSPISINTQECSFSLGLHTALTTVSGAYFDDLLFTSGYLRYPVLSSMYYGTMSMDNVKKNQSTVISIYDIDIDGDNLYRLQGEATYYGTDYTWTTYNYQISPIRSFIDFITVDAVSHILPATGRNTTVVTSITLDQYGQGVVNRPVTFADDDPIGFVTTKKVNTDIFYNTGRADTGYTSGTALRVVTIDASVTQED